MNTSEVDGIRGKAYVYVRVSTKEQVDGASLDVQEKSCREYAENVLHVDVVRVYREEGESAKTAKRTQLTKMLIDASREKGLINFAVFYCPDRASRNGKVFRHTIKEQLRKYGVELRYAMQPGIDGSRSGDLLENIMIDIAEFENGLKADKVREAMAERARQGYWVTQPPLGFKVKVKMSDGTLSDSAGRKERIKLPKVLVPDDTILPGETESIASKITKVMSRFAEGNMTEMEAYRMAVGLGIKTTTGKTLPFNSFHHMLEHPVYAGYSKPGRALQESIKLQFDGLINLSTFNRIQTILRTGKKKLEPKSDVLYPLDGTILCPHCNMPFHGDAPRDGSDNRKPRYYCRGGIKRGHGYESAKASEIHAVFYEFIQQVTPTDGAIRLLKEALRRTAMVKLGNANAELRELKEQDEKLTERKNRALEMLVDGNISIEEKDSLVKNLDVKREKIRARRMELEEQQSLNETIIEYVCNFMTQPAKLWLDADLASKRALQKLMFPNGLHIDLKTKKCRTEDLSPLYSVINTKKEPNGSNSDDMVISRRVELLLTG